MSHPQAPPIESCAAERAARRFWVSVIVGLLGLQIAIGAASIALSLGDPSMAIVPHYHQAALDWDATIRASELVQRLGWNVGVEVGQPGISEGERLLTVTVRDQSGNGQCGLSIRARYFHHARGSKIYQLQLSETGDGAYSTPINLDRHGLWQFDLQVEGERGIARVSREVEVPPVKRAEVEGSARAIAKSKTLF